MYFSVFLSLLLILRSILECISLLMYVFLRFLKIFFKIMKIYFVYRADRFRNRFYSLTFRFPFFSLIGII